MKQVNVLFICMGNICRSPTAEGVFRHTVNEAGLNEKIHIDSAGTHAYHVGQEPDKRAQAAALQRGIDLSNQRARKVEEQDFEQFDYIIAMDHSNHSDLIHIAKDKAKNLHMFLNFADKFSEEEVPDPYYGGEQGFKHVLDLVEDASNGLLQHIRENHSI